MKQKYKHLSWFERREIYYLRHYKSCSLREIARRLNRSHSTIIREVKRNSGCWCDQYYHNPAHQLARIRLSQRARRQFLKSTKTREFVIQHLKVGWTPEIISGRLKIRKNLKYVCHESIYQFIYKEAPELREYLPRKHKTRRKKYPYRKYISKIAYRTSILKRPKEINDRLLPGHWESDSIESKGRKCALNVLLERVSRLTHITRLPTKESADTKNAIIKRLSKHPENLVKSITYDNGVENAAHLKVNQELGCESYFCQPYRSWEKGAVEQLNSLVRRFLPKGTDFTEISDKTLREIEDRLNSRPRKCLGYKTPFEVYAEISGALPI